MKSAKTNLGYIIKTLAKKIIIKTRIVLGLELNLEEEIRLDKVTLGDAGAAWSIYPAQLNETSVVYSFGVGTNISFDLELIKRYNCKVFAFDPTPKSIQWIKSLELPANFSFYEKAISKKNGFLDFYLPKKKDHVSHSLISSNKNGEYIKVPASTLKTIMQELNHSHIDILKMDIEGAEYGVLQDILGSNIPVDQLLVEFHHRFKEISVDDTKTAIKNLQEKGYKIFAISESREEYSFIRCE